MWAYVENNEIKGTYAKLPKNGTGGTNLYSLKRLGNLYDSEGNVVIEDHDFGTDYEALKQHGFYEAQEVPAPEYDATTHNYPNQDFIFEDGQVKQIWCDNPKSEEQIAAERNASWGEVEVMAKALLAETDWSQGRDIKTSTAEKWQPYREALREIIRNPTDPAAVVWPDKPE